VRTLLSIKVDNQKINDKEAKASLQYLSAAGNHGKPFKTVKHEI
jgi:uncharacterized membrane protein YvbJ